MAIVLTYIPSDKVKAAESREQYDITHTSYVAYPRCAAYLLLYALKSCQATNQQ
jgi:hypothetical protein